MGGGGSLADGRVPGGVIKALVVVGALAVAFVALWQPLKEAIDSVSEAVGSVGDSVTRQPPAEGSPADPPGGGAVRVREPAFGGVRDVARALNEGGLRCRPVRVDAEDDYVSTGSCQAGPVHVQINVYLNQSSLSLVKESFFSEDFPFAFVLKGNTYVITQAPVARRVHRVIGGRLRLPR